MLEALQASSLHGFQQSTVATRTIFREPLHCREKHEQKRYFAAAALKKRNHIPVSSIVSAGKGIEGDLSCLTCCSAATGGRRRSVCACCHCLENFIRRGPC